MERLFTSTKVVGVIKENKNDENSHELDATRWDSEEKVPLIANDMKLEEALSKDRMFLRYIKYTSFGCLSSKKETSFGSNNM